jgi:RHS repeat-associated protein
MLFPAAKLGDMVIGLDIHKGLIPAPPSPVPVPGPPLPYPYIGSLFLWLSPQWPSTNVFVNGMPAATVGTKGYSLHVPPIPPHILTPPLQLLSWKWYLQNLLTVVIATNFQIIIGTVRGMIDHAIKGQKVPSAWQSYLSTIEGMHNWSTLFQALMPPAVLPIAEGNSAIGSPTVTVNGAPMAMVGPLFACSCSEIPIVPNAGVMGGGNVMVGITFTDLLMQFAWNAVTDASKFLAGKIVEKIKCKIGLEPIDLVSGCNFEDKTDFELPGPIPFSWVRAYRNLRNDDGPLGFCWTHEYHRYLAAREDGFDYVDSEGMHYALPFLPNIGDTYFHPTAFLQFSRLSETIYRIQTKDNILYSFEFPNLSPRAFLMSVADLNGNEIRFSYNKERRLNQIRDSASRSIAVEYNGERRIARLRLTGDSQEEANNILVAYEYDSHGNLSKVIDAAGNTYIYEYDDNHWMTKKTDRNGYSFHYEYNPIGQCIKSYGDDGLYSGEMQYYLLARTTLFKIPNGSMQTYKYNELNLITGVIDAYGNVSVFNYDRMGNLDSEIDPNDNVRRLAYDERGNIVEEMDFQGRTTQRKWNELNLKIEETNAAGATRKWLHDERGNLVEETDALGAVTQHRYNERGWRIETREPSGDVKRFGYFSSGLLRAVRDQSGRVLERFKYDILGNLVRQEVNGQITRFKYDKLSRLIEIEHPNESRERRTYDAESNLTAHQDAQGRIWRYRYSSWNKLTEETDPLGHTTKYGYNRADELESVTDPGGTLTQYEYDLNDRLARVIRHGTLKETYLRDRAGTVVGKLSQEGQSLVSIEVGEGNRVAAKRYGSRGPSRFEYDEAGRPCSAERNGFVVSLKYDALDRPIEQNWNNDFVKYGYDEQGRFSKIAWSEGAECIFEFDKKEGGLKLTDPSGGVHEIFGIGGQLQAHLLPNGLTELRSLDLDGRLIELSIRRRAGEERPIVFRRKYRYDAAGNLVEIQDGLSRQHANFSYDTLGKLIGVAHSEGLIRKIAYDAAGNPYATPNSEVPAGNRLRRVGEMRYDYDERGNVVRRERDREAVRLAYDESDSLIETETSQKVRTAYGYDAFDKRAWKQTGSQRTEFHWNVHRLCREIRDENSRRIYVYLSPDENAPAMFVDLKRESGGEWQKKSYYIHQDGIGTPIAVSDESGEIVWSLETEPFGQARVNDPLGLDFNLRAPGQYFDTETGLCYNGYRIYDPETNRFLQPDPLGLAGNMNLYAYPANPLQQTDPLGLSTGCGGGKGKPEEEQGKPTAEGTPPAPKSLKQLPKFRGRTPKEIRQMLKEAGWTKVSEGDGLEKSEIWYGPQEGGSQQAVRIDDGGHPSQRGKSGSVPHVHREQVPAEHAEKYKNAYVPEAQTLNDNNQVVPKPATNPNSTDPADRKAWRDWGKQTHNPTAQEPVTPSNPAYYEDM